MEEVTVRRAVPQDAYGMSVVHGVMFEQGWDADFFSTCIMDGEHFIVFVAECHAHIVGITMCRRVVDEAELITIGVLEEWRGRSLAKQMSQAVLRVLAEHAVAKCFLEVQIDNIAAMRLYEVCGFEKVGVRKGYYETRDGRKDAVMMICNIVA